MEESSFRQHNQVGGSKGGHSVDNEVIFYSIPEGDKKVEIIYQGENFDKQIKKQTDCTSQYN